MSNESKCQICSKPTDVLNESNGYHFCNKCFGKGTIIVGLMSWKKRNPDYKHPKVGDFSTDISFEELLELYTESLKKQDEAG